MSVSEQELNQMHLQCVADMSKFQGALGAAMEIGRQVDNALRAASMEGVPEGERAVALKYLGPILSFCTAARDQYNVSAVKEQGKLELLHGTIEGLKQPSAADAPSEG